MISPYKFIPISFRKAGAGRIRKRDMISPYKFIPISFRKAGAGRKAPPAIRPLF
ncbi:hypothetical protein [Bradyrhizobium sp. CCBAU 21362]|uniref:hypothetical protein n=1 Tax=Bradyrhizobium sp. CCBAU 21362 TaxID=1325082 RepID=UPI002305416F|nr:hypothetical protein [Bradyrhizobium sp. CCBAU 21362]